MPPLPPGREEEAISLQNSGKHIYSQPDLRAGLDGEIEMPPHPPRSSQEDLVWAGRKWHQ